MGIEKRNTAFRLSAEDLQDLADIQTAFSPFLEDRSSTVRALIKLGKAAVKAMLSMPHTLQGPADPLQLLLRLTLFYGGGNASRLPAQSALEEGVGLSVGGTHKRQPRAASLNPPAFRTVEQGMEAWFPSFPLQMRSIAWSIA